MRVIVDMPDELVAGLDAHATQEERSRAWVVRRACAVYVGVLVGEEVSRPVRLPTAEEFTALLNNELDCSGFAPQPGNVLRCSACGRKKGEH